MIEWLWSGFEQHLYAPEDYPQVFWYLDYLLGCAIQSAQRASEHVASVARAEELSSSTEDSFLLADR